MLKLFVTGWKDWPKRSQAAAQGNAQQAAVVLAQQRREREDAERYVADVTRRRGRQRR